LANGVAKELARIVLPVSMFTEIYVSCDVHNLMHFLNLRQDAHAQLEIREIADAMAVVFKELFPWSYEAHIKHRLRMVEL
jgi:thymidylate synthase (FAD)